MLTPLAVAAALTAALVSCSSGGGGSKDASEQTARDFLTAWSGGDLAKAASLTDNPQTATTQLTDIRNQLSPIKAQYDPHGYTKAKGSTPAQLAYSATYTLQGIGDPVKWDASVPVVQQNGKSVVHWTQSLVHPQLADGYRFALTRTLPPRAAILDRNGQPLSASVPVVTISLWPSHLTNANAVYAALADPVFGGVDVNALKQRVAASKPDNAVTVVTLRKDVWDSQAKAKLANLDGIQLAGSNRQVATGVAKYLVGSVQPANADLLKNAGPSASASDEVGASGLQYRYQQQLAGTPTVTLAIVDQNKAPKVTLVNVQGKPGTNIKTTIDPKYETAAENLIKTEPVNGAIVAIQPSTGNILAAANNPADGDNRAFSGQYPPGSTMKIITSSALLSNGVNVNDPVQCPQTVTVNGQSFENQDMFTLPAASTTLVQDFARSCNTAFISLRDKLQNDTLTNTAKAFGFGGSWDVGLPSFDGSVPVATSPNEKAAGMIGQGKVLMSPLDMASVAATAQSGTFRQPVLVPDQVKPYQAPTHLDPNIANNVRNLMRAAVNDGTASGLKGAVPGDIGAKTGTAEFGNQNPPQMHAWLVVFKDDLAVCILLEDGGNHSNKVDLMKQFLQQVQ